MVRGSRGFSNLSSNSLSDLLKTTRIVEFEALARTLSWCHGYPQVKVGSGLHFLPGLLLQLLTELLPLYGSYVSCTEKTHTADKCGPNAVLLPMWPISELFHHDSLDVTNPIVSNLTQVFFICDTDLDTYPMVYKVTAVWAVMSHFIHLYVSEVGISGSIQVLIFNNDTNLMQLKSWNSARH